MMHHEEKSRGVRRQVVVLGSTGSIGVNTLKVIEHLRESCGVAIEVVGLAAGSKVGPLIEQARHTGARAIAVADDSADIAALKAALPGVSVFVGADSALRMVESLDATDLVAAIVGAAGLPATLAAIRKGWKISLANKETLVAAGELVSPLVKKHGSALLPVDSEHSAIFQCLHEQPAGSIKRIVLTASGGPFRTVDKETMRQASVEQALAHPTWKMGPKITIDSATMMNKALEVVEAHWLFDLPAEKIRVIIHPQSVAHSFVEFEDHSVLAQLGSPDMKTPIQYALMYPERPVGCSQPMDWTKLSRLDFEQPDTDKFPALRLAYDVIEAGGTAGAIFNAANEAAVAAFLDRRVRFGRIVELVEEALAAIAPVPVDSLATVLEADRQARQFVQERLRVEAGVA